MHVHTVVIPMMMYQWKILMLIAWNLLQAWYN